jgi:hypothetical protein
MVIRIDRTRIACGNPIWSSDELEALARPTGQLETSAAVSGQADRPRRRPRRAHVLSGRGHLVQRNRSLRAWNEPPLLAGEFLVVASRHFQGRRRNAILAGPRLDHGSLLLGNLAWPEVNRQKRSMAPRKIVSKSKPCSLPSNFCRSRASLTLGVTNQLMPAR